MCIFTHTIFNIILIYSDICATSSAVSLIVGVSKALHTLMASIGLETKLLIISEMASRAQSSNITLAPRKDPSSLKSMIREYISSPMIRKGGVIRK